MKLKLSHVRELITAVMQDTPADNLSYVAHPFRMLSFHVKREESKDFGGTLYSVRVYAHQDSSLRDQGVFQGEIWYLHVGQGNGAPVSARWPLHHMLMNRSISEDDLTYFGEFVIFDKTGFLEAASERELVTLWVPPRRSYNNPVNGAQGNVHQPANVWQPPVGPGSPYFQQPGFFPGFQQPGVFPQIQPHQPSFPQHNLVNPHPTELVKKIQRNEFINQVDQAQIQALAPFAELVDEIKKRVRAALGHPKDFVIENDGSLQQVFRIDRVIAEKDLKAVQRLLSKTYRDTGVSVAVTRATVDFDTERTKQVSVTVRIS